MRKVSQKPFLPNSQAAPQVAVKASIHDPVQKIAPDARPNTFAITGTAANDDAARESEVTLRLGPKVLEVSLRKGDTPYRTAEKIREALSNTGFVAIVQGKESDPTVRIAIQPPALSA